MRQYANDMGNNERRAKLGDAIRKERERQGLSQRKLAQMTGASSHSYIHEIEHGNKSVGFDTLCTIADALDVRVNYFFTEL